MIQALTKRDFTPRTAAGAAEQLARKAALTGAGFDALSADAKQHAFTIAGLHKVSLVQRARNLVHNGIKDGLGWDEIQRLLLDIFDTADIPRPALFRLRLAFAMQSQRAYHDARRAVLDEPDMLRVFPYRQYLTVGNGTPGVRGVRATHAALHGLVFKSDDPFWDSHTPPWGFNCRCFFRALTRRMVQQMGVRVVNVGYIRKRIKVPGQKRRGIAADPLFKRGGFDMSGIEAELKRALGAIGD